MMSKIEELKTQRIELNNDIENHYVKEIIKTEFTYKITDHALIRYLQRVELIPVSEARYKILSSIQNFMTEVKPKLNLLENNTFELRLNSIIYVIRNRTVITIKTDD